MDSADDVRHARRAFILEHHPDRGGDPQYFIVGLERLSRLPGPEDRIRVVIRPSPSWRGRLAVIGRRVMRRHARPARVR